MAPLTPSPSPNPLFVDPLPAPPATTMASSQSSDTIPPPAKRQRVETSQTFIKQESQDDAIPLPPRIHRGETVTIFTLPEQKADLRMKVFSRDFQVNSYMLKSKATFFRKALESSNSDIPPCRQEWVTQFEGGKWSLICGVAEKQVRAPILTHF